MNCPTPGCGRLKAADKTYCTDCNVSYRTFPARFKADADGKTVRHGDLDAYVWLRSAIDRATITISDERQVGMEGTELVHP